MAKNNDIGLFQLSDGNWAYRITITKDGKKKDTTSKKDLNGNPYKTKIQAKKAREQRIIELRSVIPNNKIKDILLIDIWNYYLNDYSKTKANGTVKKYSSLWENHLNNRFGSQYVSTISKTDIEIYLQELYNTPYAYKYVESFYKLFYQLWGLLYSNNNIDPLVYTKMWIDKGTKVKMPTISQEDLEDYDNIETYNTYQINQIEKVFNGGNCYTAFLLGYYCGLRVSEVFGLLWSDYNWDSHTLTIKRQMTSEDGCFCLRPVKTLKSNRVVDVPNIVHEHLLLLNRTQYRHPTQAYLNRKNEIVIDKTKRGAESSLQGADFINRKENGELLTINSLKYWRNKIKSETDIDFKFHSLRKTHLTQLAASGVSFQELMQRAGHKKIDTTMRYYINTTTETHKYLIDTINKLNTEELDIEVVDSDGNKQIIKESTYLIRQQISTVISH